MPRARLSRRQRAARQCARRVRDGERGARAAPEAHSRRRDRRTHQLDRSGSRRCSPIIRRSSNRTRISSFTPTSGRARRYRLKPGASAAATCTFDNLFYADVAIRSYRTFADSKAEGKIAPHVPFQVDLVPAHSVIWLFLEETCMRRSIRSTTTRVKREIDKLAAAIPHERARDPVRCGLRRVRAAGARTSRTPTAATRTKCSTRSARSCGKLGNHVPGRHRTAVSLLLRRFQSPPRGRADRHGRHGGTREPACARASTRSIESDPHAGAARPLGRCLFRAAHAAQAAARTRNSVLVSCTTPTGSRARAAASPRRRNMCRTSRSATECGFGRRPPDTISGAVAHPRRCGGVTPQTLPIAGRPWPHPMRRSARCGRRARRLGAAVEGLSGLLQGRDLRPRPRR